MLLDQEAMQILYDCAAEVDPNYIHTLIDEFIADAFRMLDEMDVAYAQNDGLTVRRIAHTLKSQSLSYGAKEFAATCLALESLTKSGELDGAKALIEQIKREYPEVERALHEELARNK